MRPYEKIYGDPDDKIYCHEDDAEDKEHHRLKGDPGVEHVGEGVSYE